MKPDSDLGLHVRLFLGEYLPRQRNASRRAHDHPILTYADDSAHDVPETDYYPLLAEALD